MRHFFFLAALCLPLVLPQPAFPQFSSGEQQTPMPLAAECDLSGGMPVNSNVAACTGPSQSDLRSGYEVITTAVTPPANGICPTTSVGPCCGARSSIGAAVTPIDAWGTCRWVDNTGPDSLFVPFRTPTEWGAFKNAASPQHGLPGIALTDCAIPVGRATISVAPPYPNAQTPDCNRVNFTPPNVPNVYGRTGISLWPSPIPSAPSVFAPAFTCHGTTTVTSKIQWIAGDADHPNPISGLSWNPNYQFSPDLTLTAYGLNPLPNPVQPDTEVILSFKTDKNATSCTASDSTAGNDGWNGGSWNRSQLQGNPPTLDVTVYPAIITTYTVACTNSNNQLTSTASVTVNVNEIGVCGSDNGAKLTSKPINLCNAGTASTVSGPDSGPWAWTCSATDDESKASCSTSSSCSGSSLGGYCWYLGGANQSCDQACALHGGCNAAGTINYAGSGGTAGNCIAVESALGLSGPYREFSTNWVGLGCAYENRPERQVGTTTTCAGSGGPSYFRTCACNN